MAREIHPLFDLTGRVALVTGGGSGLGREFCDVLAEFGADVVCNALHQERADETCKIIKKHGHRALAIAADVSKYDQVQAMFQRAEETMGRLDILVNNAGVTTPPAVIHQTEPGEWHRLIGIDLNGVFYCMKAGLKIMLKQKKGSIINIASVVGLNAGHPEISGSSAYAAAKSGVIGLTKQGAVEYGSYGIRVNCIAPGWHLGTRLGASAGKKRTTEELEAFMQALVSMTPMKRTGEPAEIKGLLLYLASDASSFVTGQTIVQDGGWTSW